MQRIGVCFHPSHTLNPSSPDSQATTADKVCSACHVAFYCSEDHQKKHWKPHKSDCLSWRQAPDTFIHLQKEACEWKGEKPTIYIPVFIKGQEELGREMPRKEWWGAYARVRGVSTGLISLVSNLVKESGVGKTAIDIGCGTSVTNRYLLENKWHVIGVDSSEQVVAMMQFAGSIRFSGQFELVCSPVEAYRWPAAVDLVVASNALSYLNPLQIYQVLKSICAALKPDGLFIGNFYAFKYTAKATIEMKREMGCWFVRDEKDVDLLLTLAGFKIVKMQRGNQDENPDTVCFVAKIPGKNPG